VPFDRLWRLHRASPRRASTLPARPETQSARLHCELRIIPPLILGHNIRLSAQLLRPDQDTAEIWFTLPKEHSSSITHRADPLILAALIPAASSAPVLRVTGAPASVSLLRNLTEFQEVWRAWRGFKTTTIEAVHAQDEVQGGNAAIAAFSGGVDSSFTAYRHAAGREPERQVLQAALMVHGFDIPLADSVGFERAVQRARRMLDLLRIPLIPMQTNLREFLPDWELLHGIAVAAALTVLSNKFSAGLIASAGTYALPLIPWGSNPLTDPLLGSRCFSIVHDGASSSRLQKISALGQWPEGVKDLRFCWQNMPADENCGRCLKCILTALEFRCAGYEATCFSAPVTDATIMKVLADYKHDPHGDLCFHEVLEVATAQAMNEPWIPALRRVLHNERAPGL
jgi:hypothetical protein